MTKVLIVDDEVDIREVLTRVLERESLEVRVAETGAEGLKKFREELADIVITDIIMPDVDGIEFIRSLRSEFPGTRIIAISGGGNMGPLGYRPESISTTAYLVAAERAGANCVITKPFDREELMTKIRELLDG